VKVADERAKLCFALGKAADDLGDYAGAMRWFGQANAVKAKVARLDRPRLARQVDALIAAYPADFVAAHAGKGEPSARPVFVLGLPRSGTTLVEQILSSHPQVAGAGELTFWNTRDPLARGLGGGMGAVQKATAEACLARLAGVDADAARVVDKNPFNFFWAGLIHVVFPNAVIFHCRRAAIDTCLSIHSTWFPPRPDFSTNADDLVAYWREYVRLTDHWRASGRCASRSTAPGSSVGGGTNPGWGR
jgi:hypothetical protein